MGSSHHSLSSLSAEERVSSPITDLAFSSSVSAGSGERTVHSVTDHALAGGMETSASYAKTSSSPGPAQPASVEQSGMANASTSSRGFATETLFAHSSKIPTYFSFQNDLTSKCEIPHKWHVFWWGEEVRAVLLLSMSHTKFSFMSTCGASCRSAQGDVLIKGLKARPCLSGELFQK